MKMKMTRETFEAIIAQDLEWLLAQEETVARRHIEAIVKAAPNHYYPPIDAPGLIALSALARHFDERHADKSTLAEELRESDSVSYSEHRAIADTYEAAASTVWALCGGRPNEHSDPHVRRAHHINIDVRELGRLIELGTRSQASPTSKNVLDGAQFDEGLVERLVQLVRNMPPFRERHTYNEVADVVRAILSVLASMLVEMPTANELLAMWFDDKDEGRGGWIGNAMRLQAKLASGLGPVLAAKATCIDSLGRELVQAKARIARLEKQLADETSLTTSANSLYASAVALHNASEERSAERLKRIAELEKRLAIEGTAALQRVADLIAITGGYDDPRSVRGVREGEELLLREKVVKIINDVIADISAHGIAASPATTSSPTMPRVFLGITFERERADGSRENDDPSAIRLVVGDDPTPLVMASAQRDRAP